MAAVSDSFAAACAEGARWPLPGSGGTAQRWSQLSRLAADDLVLGRLVEAHADAVAILAELGGELPGQSRWGVWAAEGRDVGLQATTSDGGWQLEGRKPWCSGATLLTHALVTASAADGRRLFAVDLSHVGVVPELGTWTGLGMAASDTLDVDFAAVPARPVGGPGAYLDRPGFWAGGIGVAACWYGGACGVARPLVARVAAGAEPHAAAHLGAVHVALRGARALLLQAAAVIDRAEAAQPADLAVLARTVRGAVDRTVAEVVDRVGRALGPAPLARDAAHSQLVADLGVYVRQSHAERDLAALGEGLGPNPEWPL